MKNFSIIIPVFNREIYIKDLVTSLIKHTESLNGEIIVVKNLVDKDIDKFLDDLSIKSIYTDDTTLGGKIYLGINASESDKLFLLEDDDIFAKNKIRHVLDIFRNNRNIDFYHNSIIPFSTKLPNEEQEISLDKIQIFESGSLSYSQFRKLLNKYKAGFNVSSIVISKKIADECKNLLKNVEVTDDTFLFFCAIEKNARFVIDLNPLTYYRVPTPTLAKGKIRLNLFKMQLDDAYYFSTIFSNKFIKREFDSMIAQRELIYRILTEQKVDRKITLKIIERVRQPTKWDLFLNLLLLIHFFSLSTSKKVYLKLVRTNSMLA
jgi:glycosyltransferase involved in cell wall biosynthesis